MVQRSQRVPPSGLPALKEAAPGNGFLIGITEDVPEHRWRESFAAILETCRTDGRTPIAA